MSEKGTIEFIGSREPCTRLVMSKRLAGLGYPEPDFETAIREFQTFNGLVVDGNAGPITEDYLMYRPRCANADIRRAGTCKWPMLDVDYWHNLKFNSMTQANVNKAFLDACESWNAVCGIRLKWTDSQREANIYAHPKVIDGRGGTLAWSFLPCGASQRTRLEQRYDTRENWSQSWLQSVIAHEIGHALGLDHDTADTLMGAYSSGIVLPTRKDIAQVVRRYGDPEPEEPPTPVPPIPPTPQPPGEGPTVEGEITINSKPYILVPKVDY